MYTQIFELVIFYVLHDVITFSRKLYLGIYADEMGI